MIGVRQWSSEEGIHTWKYCKQHVLQVRDACSSGTAWSALAALSRCQRRGAALLLRALMLLPSRCCCYRSCCFSSRQSPQPPHPHHKQQQPKDGTPWNDQLTLLHVVAPSGGRGGRGGGGERAPERGERGAWDSGGPTIPDVATATAAFNCAVVELEAGDAAAALADHANREGADILVLGEMRVEQRGVMGEVRGDEVMGLTRVHTQVMCCLMRVCCVTHTLSIPATYTLYTRRPNKNSLARPRRV